MRTWQERTEEIRELLGRYPELQFRADLVQGRFWWQTLDGAPVVVAECALLLTYAHSNGSYLMAHANPAMQRAKHVPAVEGLAHGGRVTEAEAAQLAEVVAQIAGAEFVYAAPGGNGPAFLALYNVREATPGTQPFVPGPATDFIEQSFRGLHYAVSQGRPEEELVALLSGFAAKFEHGAAHTWGGTADAPRLLAAAQALRSIVASDRTARLSVLGG